MAFAALKSEDGYSCEKSTDEPWQVVEVQRHLFDNKNTNRLQIPWIARRTNRSILDQIKRECSLESFMIEWKLAYFGHITWIEDSLEKAVMVGMVEGKWKRGRSRSTWLDAEKKDTNMSFQDLKNAIKVRDHWRNFIHQITKSRTRLMYTHMNNYLTCHLVMP